MPRAASTELRPWRLNRPPRPEASQRRKSQGGYGATIGETGSWRTRAFHRASSTQWVIWTRIRELPYRPAPPRRRKTGRPDGSIRLRVRTPESSCAEGGVHRWKADASRHHNFRQTNQSPDSVGCSANRPQSGGQAWPCRLSAAQSALRPSPAASQATHAADAPLKTILSRRQTVTRSALGWSSRSLVATAAADVSSSSSIEMNKGATPEALNGNTV